MELLNKMREFLINYEIATEGEVDLVEQINGTNIDTYENILYRKTGYMAFYQIDNWEGGEYDR